MDAFVCAFAFLVATFSTSELWARARSFALITDSGTSEYKHKNNHKFHRPKAKEEKNSEQRKTRKQKTKKKKNKSAEPLGDRWPFIYHTCKFAAAASFCFVSRRPRNFAVNDSRRRFETRDTNYFPVASEYCWQRIRNGMRRVGRWPLEICCECCCFCVLSPLSQAIVYPSAMKLDV